MAINDAQASVLESLQMLTPLILLASASPRRQQMLAWTGWTFEVQPADVDESLLPGEAPAAYVSRLAESKARAVEPFGVIAQVVLAADTTVADDFGLLGKPATPDEALEMLRRLRGRSHRVFTAITVSQPGKRRRVSDLCVSQVPMRAYSDAEMEAYVASGDPLDKAGAYAIQHAGFHPVENFRGCFASVMGLPLCHLARSMAKLGLTPPVDIPAVCQQNLRYDCPISQKVLAGENTG